MNRFGKGQEAEGSGKGRRGLKSMSAQWLAASLAM